MTGETKFQWRFVILLTLGVGSAIGLLIGILDTFFNISIPPILGGLIAGIIIGFALATHNRSTET